MFSRPLRKQSLGPPSLKDKTKTYGLTNSYTRERGTLISQNSLMNDLHTCFFRSLAGLFEGRQGLSLFPGARRFLVKGTVILSRGMSDCPKASKLGTSLSQGMVQTEGSGSGEKQVHLCTLERSPSGPCPNLGDLARSQCKAC